MHLLVNVLIVYQLVEEMILPDRDHQLRLSREIIAGCHEGHMKHKFTVGPNYGTSLPLRSENVTGGKSNGTSSNSCWISWTEFLENSVTRVPSSRM